MQQIIGNFIQALRHHGLPVSPAETLDALRAVQLIGLQNPQRLKAALGMTLAKNLSHQQQFEDLFEQFFQLNQGLLDQTSTQALPSAPEAVTSDADQPDSPTRNSALSQPQDTPDQEAVKSPLAKLLLDDNQTALQMAIASGGESSGASEMRLFTQKAQVSYRILQQLGDRQLTQELSELATDEHQLNLVEDLKQRRQRLLEQIQDYVEQQYLLYSQKAGQQLRESNLQKIKLTNIDHSYLHQMTKLVQKTAKQLASMHSRRRRLSKRGLLDVKKTIAANAAYDGFMFHTKWKSTRVERPKVMVLCDVSGSVSRVARFLLLFLYSLQDVLPRVRSFVFASNLGEVTEEFTQLDLNNAIAQIMDQWANRPTDYGRALVDFKQLALKDIDNKTTVIMLGDARNNNSESQAGIWREVYQRSQRVLWLNPEGRYSWNSGDSIMNEYAPFCSRVEPCNSLRDLSRILGSLLKHS
ncbi:VWA domain-containing protein [Aestuariicella hydrocarbonica]|uniref:VWA domain-containing protein n=1 Tax=Pseudomaricurvus hydrocarbonicus TaxID=1470433 RepID=A0A9E5JVN5_9GAMM|nr:VWA domain-containing protein [Aestuariicella hydrocarbonica]NHO65411.1 VWA domain-containing protein [Aestuariicella hydrocarbonica]